MTDALQISPHALATEVAGGTGASVDIGAQRTCLRLDLIVESMAATSLSAFVEHAPAAAGPWLKLADLPTVTAAVTRETLVLYAKRFIRLRWAMVGADARFSVTGEAHTLFATPKDVADNALPEKASENLPAGPLAKACLAATDEAATYLNGAFPDSPIQTWGAALTMHVSKMARYHIMDRRGYQPGGPDELIAKGYDDAIKWLTMVSLGKIRPPAIADATPTKFKNSARVTSRSSSRGW